MNRCSTAQSQIIASPGVSLREPFLMSAAVRGVPIVGDIELFAREARAPIAAITGTNGKSTVTTLVASMANASGKRVLAGGNLGRPALELLDEPVPELYVLELSSFQLETTRSLRTAAAAVLNVTPDHMDRYETLEEYAAAKARIFERCDAAVVNLDDFAVRAMPYRAARVLGFSLRRRSRGRLLRASTRRRRRAHARPRADRRDVGAEDRRLAQRGERARRARDGRSVASAARSMRAARCASFPACRIARNGSPTFAACAT